MIRSTEAMKVKVYEKFSRSKVPTLLLQPYPSTPSKGDEAVMGYHPGHTVTPGVEVDFSVDAARGGDNANWTDVKNCL